MVQQSWYVVGALNWEIRQFLRWAIYFVDGFLNYVATNVQKDIGNKLCGWEAVYLLT